MSPDFSVIIPALNEERFLPTLLTNLVEQTFLNFEVILIDAKSEDHTVEEAKKFDTKLNLSIKVSARRNLSFQRNLGASLAKGKYLVFIDADNEIDNDFLEKMYRETSQSKGLIFLPKMMPQGGNSVDRMLFETSNMFIELSQQLHIPISTPGMIIFEQGFFKFLDGYKEVTEHDDQKFFPEDQEILVRAKKSGVIAKYLDEVKYYFSLRRIKKDGWWKSYFQNTFRFNMLDMVTNKISSRDTQYEMGGDRYQY